MPTWDTFISHASEDKASVARPLAAMLERRGLRVWLDENELVLGRGLSDQIDRGLANSDFGVVILSEAFFEKSWTRLELDALVNRSLYREKWLIPVWHRIDHSYLLSKSPILAGRFAANTVAGLAIVADKILHTVRPHKQVDLPTHGERQGLADEFVQRLRSGDWTGRAFETDIGKETMTQIRGQLKTELLTDTTQEPGLRNRAASLLFGDRLRGNRGEFSRISAAVRDYYDLNVETDPWQVLRSVALAVADQVNDATLIFDWLERIRVSDGLVEANLVMSDEYNGGVRSAIDNHVRRVRQLFRRFPAGRFWEVFYLGRGLFQETKM